MKQLKDIITLLKSHLGMSISGFAHFVLFVILIINFPQCSQKKNNELIIAVDLLPISNLTNIENKNITKPKEEKIEEKKPIAKAEEKPVVKEEPKVKEKPVVKEEPKVEEKPIVKEEPKAEEKPVVKEEPKKDDVVIKKKTEPKKEVPKKEEPKKKIDNSPKKVVKKEQPKKKPQKPKMSDIDKLLKNLQAEEQKNDSQESTSDKPSKGPFDPSSSLSMSVKDSIKRQIEQYWNPPAGNKEAAKLQILLRITFKIDGTVARVKVIDNNRYNSDEQYQVAADAAVRAVHKASPLQNLPNEQYSSWQDLELNFNPSDILGD